MERTDFQAVERLTQAVEKVYDQPRKAYSRSFLMGIFYGIGTTLGVAILVTIFGVIVKYMGGFPVIGDWINSVGQHLQK